MGFGDKLKQLGDKAKESAAELGDKAKESAAEHREQISHAVETAGVVADRRTRGRYTDKIMKAANRTEAAVDKFAGSEEPGSGETAAPDAAAPADPPA